MTLVTERPHHPVRCAVAQIYAHITRGFRRVPFPEKKKKIYEVKYSDWTIREVGNPGVPFQSFSIYLALYTYVQQHLS